jgi:hypothetical protein
VLVGSWGKAKKGLDPERVLRMVYSSSRWGARQRRVPCGGFDILCSSIVDLPRNPKHHMNQAKACQPRRWSDHATGSDQEKPLCPTA